MTSAAKQVYNKLISSQSVFILGHPRCGDALGSTLAMLIWLKELKKNVVAFSREEVPENFRFLPSEHLIINNFNNINLSDFDVVLLLDTDIPHSGVGEKLENDIDRDNSCLINIDHHVTNNGVGDINLIDKNSASTTKILYDFFQSNQIKINKEMAICLLTGIIYDTGIFSNAATDHQSLTAAGRLLEQGVPLAVIINNLTNNKTIKLLRLWGRVLEKLNHQSEYDIVYTTMTSNDFGEDFDSSKAGELANFLNNLAEGKFVMIVKESSDGLLKVSLRTTRADVDLARFAEYFGGGGHRKASGFALPGSLVYNEQEGSIRVV